LGVSDIRKIFIIVILILIIAAGLFIFNTFSSQISSGSNDENTINITFTGDVMLGRDVDDSLRQNPHPFAGIINLTNGTDLTVINLETPLTLSTDQTAKKDITVKTDPQFTYLLRDAGIDVASLANNHVMDFGQSGFNDTLVNLQQNGIKYVGAGNNVQEAFKPLIITIKGKKIAIIAASEFTSSKIPSASETSPGFAAITRNRLKAAIAEAKAAGADYIICELHYGAEYNHTPTEFQQNISHMCIDQGAYMVIGHHSHVPQTIENYKGKLIFYSLGNCVFDQPFPETKKSMIVVLNIIGEQPQVQIYPIDIVNNYPELMGVNNGTAFLQELQSYSVNVTIDIKDGLGVIKI
jgi:poly-gamma-glutamate synthesis protein (capsule biosynthesis protein)